MPVAEYNSKIYQEMKLLIDNLQSNEENIVASAKKKLEEFRDQNDKTAWHYAAIFETSESLKLLLRTISPKLIYEADNAGKTILHYAALSGQVENIDLFLRTVSPELIYKADNSGNTVWHDVASITSLDGDNKLAASQNMITSLITFSPESMDRINNEGMTALMIAVRADNTGVVKNLLIADAKTIIHKKSVLDYELLGSEMHHLLTIVAKQKDKKDLVKLLEDWVSALYYAVKEGDVAMVDLILEKEPKSIRLKDKNGNTALHLAVRLGKSNIVEKILYRDQDSIDLKNKNGDTALHYAVIKGDLEIFRVILDKDPGAIRLKDNQGKTARDYAGQGSEIELLLIEAEKTEQDINAAESDKTFQTLVAGRRNSQEKSR
jgi:ankyrin repeat protein